MILPADFQSIGDIDGDGLGDFLGTATTRYNTHLYFGETMLSLIQQSESEREYFMIFQDSSNTAMKIRSFVVKMV